jgi:hypothetical protein
MNTEKLWQAKGHYAGTTMTAAFITGPLLTIANVGDSQAMVDMGEAEGRLLGDRGPVPCALNWTASWCLGVRDERLDADGRPRVGGALKMASSKRPPRRAAVMSVEPSHHRPGLPGSPRGAFLAGLTHLDAAPPPLASKAGPRPRPRPRRAAHAGGHPQPPHRGEQEGADEVQERRPHRGPARHPLAGPGQGGGAGRGPAAHLAGWVPRPARLLGRCCGSSGVAGWWQQRRAHARGQAACRRRRGGRGRGALVAGCPACASGRGGGGGGAAACCVPAAWGMLLTARVPPPALRSCCRGALRVQVHRRRRRQPAPLPHAAPAPDVRAGAGGDLV